LLKDRHGYEKMCTRNLEESKIKKAKKDI